MEAVSSYQLSDDVRNEHMAQKKIVVFGSGGAIGRALVLHYAGLSDVAQVIAFSRQQCEISNANVHCHVCTDYTSVDALQAINATLASCSGIDKIIVATGLLHDNATLPEKSLQDIQVENFTKLYHANVVVPAMLIKTCGSFLHKRQPSVLAVLSARVSSVSDNRLGGWYAYRCAKAAVNMLVKNAAIELGRGYPDRKVVGLHPGTVDSRLSAPFQARLSPGQLHTPALAAHHLADVLDRIQPQDSGKLWAWDGQEILP